MSYANGTQFYNLPQTVGTDKRDWFDTNGAFAAVDAALHAAATGQAADAEAIATINTSLASAESDIAALQTASTSQASDISALQATVATQGTAITDVRQDAEDMISAFNEGAASVSTHAYAIGDYFIYNDVLYKATAAIAIGDTIVPNTNCSATNVTSEIKVINADIDDVKSDLADVEADVDELNNRTLSSGVDIPLTVSETPTYTFPSDGYISINVGGNSSINVRLYSGSVNMAMIFRTTGDYNDYRIVYVKKGMQVRCIEAPTYGGLKFFALT